MKILIFTICYSVSSFLSANYTWTDKLVDNSLITNNQMMIDSKGNPVHFYEIEEGEVLFKSTHKDIYNSLCNCVTTINGLFCANEPYYNIRMVNNEPVVFTLDSCTEDTAIFKSDLKPTKEKVYIQFGDSNSYFKELI